MKSLQGLQAKQKLASICILGVLVALNANVVAAPILTSVSAGTQAPDPVGAGSNATYVVTVTRTGNGNIDVYLSANGLPSGATATFSPTPVQFTGSTVLSATAQMVIATSASTAPGSYPFTIVAQDGASFNIVSNTATLDVTLSGPGIARMPNGGISIGFDTTPGQDCRLQATTNLSNPVWTTLCSTNSGTHNLMIFIDQDAAKYPCRFYRLAMP